MKVYSGKYSSANQASNSVVENLLKYPEIAKTLIQLYPRYTLTYLLERAGRGSREKILGDNSFEWKVMGRYNKPAVYKANSIAATANGDSGTIVFEGVDASGNGTPCPLQVGDMVRFPNGGVGIVKTSSADTGNSEHDVVVTAVKDNILNTQISAGDVVGVIGTAFHEGSAGSLVGQNVVYPDTYKNWLTIHRRKSVITGSALTDITWIENNGHRLWYFTAEDMKEKQFMYEMELQRWYGKATVTAASADDYPGDGGAPTLTIGNGLITTGDGILEQIDSANQASYTAGSLTEAAIVDFIGQLSLQSTQSEGNEWVVFTGTEGKIAFHQAMKDLIVGGGAGGSFTDLSTGSEVALGANFTTYHALGNKITLAYCPVFDDANVHSATAGLNAFGSARKKESAKMVFMDFGSTSGVSNVELIAKGAEGMNRNYIKKYIPGMVNPFDNNSMLAASGDDNFECQIMTESGIIVRNPLSCGILTAV